MVKQMDYTRLTSIGIYFKTT